MTTENILAFYRRKAGLTQKQLSDISNVSKSTIVRMERDENFIRNAKHQTLKDIADSLEIKVDLLFR